MPRAQTLHLRVEDAAGIFNADLPPSQRSYYPAAAGFVIDTHKVREFSITQENDAGGFTGSADVDYRLNQDDAWTSYQDNLVNGTRYTHLTADNIFYNQANQTFLPVANLRVDNDAYTSGGCDIWIILWE